MAILSLKAKHDYLVKVASTRDYVKAIAEFVWNSLDADASNVSVSLVRNSLGGLDHIVIGDDGVGISRRRAEHDYESLGDSWKLESARTPKRGRAMHGKEGRGRLRFYSLAQVAEWTSVYIDADTAKAMQLTIRIDAGSLADSYVQEPIPALQGTPTGTTLVLAPLKAPLDWLTSEEARSEFSAIFAPYVLQYPDVSILYDGHVVDPTQTIDRSTDLPLTVLVCPTRTIKDLSVRIVEWKTRGEHRKIFFGGEAGVVLGSQAANVTAPGFDFSIYAYSRFFEEMAKVNLLEFDDLNDPDFSRVLAYVRDEATDYFRSRQAERSGELIQELKAAGIYPYEGDPRDEVEKKERQVFDIATHAVSSYSGDFKKADNPLKKITLRLLKEAIARNPDSVSNILTAVFNLPKNKQDEFSSLLDKTELGNIIAASNLVADRVVVLKVLREMVFEPKHRTSIRERGELDVLVRDNTWLFGEYFHFTMPEAGLTKVMNRVSEELALGRPVRKARKPDGKIGRIDAFMGRALPTAGRETREFLLIELKKPSLTVGRKELDQLEDYVTAILRQPDFVSSSTRWNFYLVTTDYDDVVAGRVMQKDRPTGLFVEGPHHRVWVKKWSEIIADCDSRIEFIQEKLKIEVSSDEIEARIAHLKNSILKSGQKAPTDDLFAHDAESAPEPAE